MYLPWWKAYEIRWEIFFCYSKASQILQWESNSGDLNSKHLNNQLIWKANFYLFGIQMGSVPFGYQTFYILIMNY